MAATTCIGRELSWRVLLCAGGCLSAADRLALFQTSKTLALTILAYSPHVQLTLARPQPSLSAPDNTVPAGHACIAPTCSNRTSSCTHNTHCQRDSIDDDPNASTQFWQQALVAMNLAACAPSLTLVMKHDVIPLPQQLLPRLGVLVLEDMAITPKRLFNHLPPNHQLHTIVLRQVVINGLMLAGLAAWGSELPEGRLQLRSLHLEDCRGSPTDSEQTLEAAHSHHCLMNHPDTKVDSKQPNGVSSAVSAPSLAFAPEAHPQLPSHQLSHQPYSQQATWTRKSLRSLSHDAPATVAWATRAVSPVCARTSECCNDAACGSLDICSGRDLTLNTNGSSEARAGAAHHKMTVHSLQVIDCQLPETCLLAALEHIVLSKLQHLHYNGQQLEFSWLLQTSDLRTLNIEGSADGDALFLTLLSHPTLTDVTLSRLVLRMDYSHVKPKALQQLTLLRGCHVTTLASLPMQHMCRCVVHAAMSFECVKGWYESPTETSLGEAQETAVGLALKRLRPYLPQMEPAAVSSNPSSNNNNSSSSSNSSESQQHSPTTSSLQQLSDTTAKVLLLPPRSCGEVHGECNSLGARVSSVETTEKTFELVLPEGSSKRQAEQAVALTTPTGITTLKLYLMPLAALPALHAALPRHVTRLCLHGGPSAPLEQLGGRFVNHIPAHVSHVTLSHWCWEGFRHVKSTLTGFNRPITLIIDSPGFDALDSRTDELLWQLLVETVATVARGRPGVQLAVSGALWRW